MRVAEQVWVDQPPDVVVAAFRRRPVTWLRPFLHLAWQDGRQDRVHARDAQHDVRLRPAPLPAAGQPSYDLRWDVTSAAGRSTVTGNLTVSPAESGVVIAIVADVAGQTESPPTAVRAEEMVIRALLGHLRNAFEAGTAASADS